MEWTSTLVVGPLRILLIGVRFTSVAVRTFQPSDLAQVCAIYAASKMDELINETRQYQFLPLVDDQRRYPQLMESDIFVYDDDEVKGYGAVCGSEIRALYVSPEHRAQGVGRRLLEHMLVKSGEGASLYIAKNNHAARRLYQSYGFVITSEFETDYNGVAVTACKMSQRILETLL